MNKFAPVLFLVFLVSCTEQVQQKIEQPKQVQPEQPKQEKIKQQETKQLGQSAVIYNYVIYERPADYPNHYVMRRWTIGAGTLTPDKNIMAKEKTLEAIRKHLPPGTTKLPSLGEPDPKILETWM